MIGDSLDDPIEHEDFEILAEDDNEKLWPKPVFPELYSPNLKAIPYTQVPSDEWLGLDRKPAEPETNLLEELIKKVKEKDE